MSKAYEEWKEQNPPRPENEWERFVTQSKEINKAIEKGKK